MIGFLVRRLGQAIVVVLAVIAAMFLLIHVIPGGEARAVLGPRATAIAIAQFKRQNGLDLPLWDQFLHYVWNLARFQLGRSPKYNQPVLTLIGTRLPKTLILVGLATILALVVAIPLGIFQVVRRNRLEDYVLTGLAFIFYAMPSFLLGTLLILFFAVDLKWFPVEAPQAQSVGGILSDPRGLVLPVVTLAAITIASFSRYMRSSMMETLTQDYIRTARAKGVGPRRVLWAHALRNALIPIVTLLGLSVPAIVSGAVITEDVFNYPGMGKLAVDAALNVDIPTLLGVTFVITVATVAGNLLADILYAVVDPRIRYAAA
ncbi:ABC transporter permease [Aciditerrimonas ferrireducens]|uniref:ABC transporter permease n=1 Tax=Aciditerrimonas ferrireducens TaxID=667306 RepID=UPI002006735F|nr:ABC transporter permease [Aciditerrimonas ferrireducens]MCK4177838.1 ABC transporter permease [Aciditerrimonas ferrireducens]